MKWLNDKFKKRVDQRRNNTIKQKLSERIAHINRKMSRGASNIFRIIKTRTHFGNKGILGVKDKSPRTLNFVPKSRSRSSFLERHRNKHR